MKSHEHRSKYRNLDQYVCPACGKSWDIEDTDVPECITEMELGLRQRKAEKGTHRQTKTMFTKRV